MKKLLFSAFALGVFQLVNAQSSTTINGTDRFIEVKVSDTMKVVADIIKVKIELPNPEDNYEMSNDYYDEPYEYEDEYAEEIKISKRELRKMGATPPPPPPPPPPAPIDVAEDYGMEEIEVNFKDSISAYLKNKNIAFVFHEPTGEINPFAKDFGTKENSFDLVLTNPQDYEALKADLSEMSGVKVSVSSAETTKKYDYELALIDKLMKKANSEAGVIAKAMGVQLDKPLNVTNISLDNMYSSMFNDPSSMGGMGALFSMMGNLFKSQDEATSVVINKSIVVRFAVK
jgi:hypothetical protein